MIDPTLPIRGRGVAENPANRFVRLNVLPDLDQLDPDDAAPSPQTQFFKDTSRHVIAHNDSPDVGFDYSVNPYRGCEHGCCYCYARPTHEYLGFSAGLDFETRIMVKEDAPQLLRKELAAPTWTPHTLAFSGVTDCYQPVERRLQLTRRCLEVAAECRNPAQITTKNHLVTRDIDLLKLLAEFHACAVMISLTTLDAGLTQLMEPRTSVPRRRLAAVEALAAAGIPVGVLMAPIIPGLTDHEIPAVLNAAKNAGAAFAGFEPLRLPGAVGPLFEAWLTRHFPDRKEKILNRIRSMRGGKLNDPRFHVRMSGTGLWADELKKFFRLSKRRAGLDKPFPALSCQAFRRPSEGQMTMW